MNTITRQTRETNKPLFGRSDRLKSRVQVLDKIGQLALDFIGF
jgi:hypothetical protein